MIPAFIIFIIASAVKPTQLCHFEYFASLLRSSSSYKQPMAGFGEVASGFGKAFDLSRSRSPQSDAGYGTSFDSNESRARRDIDIDGLSELLVRTSFRKWFQPISVERLKLVP